MLVCLALIAGLWMSSCRESSERDCLALVSAVAESLERCGEDRSEAEKAMLAAMSNCEEAEPVADASRLESCLGQLDTWDCTDLGKGELPEACDGLLQFRD